MPKTIAVGCIGLAALAATLGLALAVPAARAQTNGASTMPFADGSGKDGAAKSAVCSACHGPNGNSTNPEWPRLAGQSAVYIAEQLSLSGGGGRNTRVTQPQAAALSEKDIDDLAFYSGAKRPGGLGADPTSGRGGAALSRRGDRARTFPACVA